MLLHVPIAELSNHVDGGSVDIILTDPPYPQDYLHTWQELGEFADHALVDGGHLMAMSGKAWLPQVFALLGESDLRYQWTLEFRMHGLSNGCIGRRISRSYWKPILWYTKGRNTAPPIKDMVMGAGRDKRYHEWGQPSASFLDIILRLGIPNAVICDPFVGGGATVIAAVEAGCSFIGADIDAECIRVTQERLQRHSEESLPLDLPRPDDARQERIAGLAENS